MYPCIRTYTASVSNGKLQEIVVSSAPMSQGQDKGCDTWTNLRKDCLKSNDWTLLSTQGIHPNDDLSSEYIPYCSNARNFNNQITKACVFRFSFESFNSFYYYFNDAPEALFLNGSLFGQNPTLATGPIDLSYLYNWGAATPRQHRRNLHQHRSHYDRPHPRRRPHKQLQRSRPGPDPLQADPDQCRMALARPSAHTGSADPALPRRCHHPNEQRWAQAAVQDVFAGPVIHRRRGGR